MLSKELVAASSRPIVLSILSEKESYGYAILQRVRELSDDQFAWTDGMLYPVLHRLESEGLVRAQWRQAENGRERKYYRITPDGRDALRGDQRQWRAVQQTFSKLWAPQYASI